MAPDGWLLPDEAAEALRVHRSAVYRWAAIGRLEAGKEGNRLVVRLPALPPKPVRSRLVAVPPEGTLSAAEVAEALGVPLTTVRRLARQGQLEPVQRGKREMYFRPEAVEALLEAHPVETGRQGWQRQLPVGPAPDGAKREGSERA